MPRDYRRQHDESPRSPEGLSLSTGRFAGRPGAGSSRTRHNPLRDEDRLPRSAYDRTRTLGDDDYDDYDQGDERDHRRRNGRDRYRERDDRRDARERDRSRDRDRDDEYDDRRRSNSPRENRAGGSRSGGGRHITAPEPEGPITVQDMLANVLSTLPSTVRHAGHGQSFRRGVDWQTAALFGVIAVLVAIIIMAIAHIGPFAPAAPSFDAEHHAGAQSVIAVQSHGGTVAKNVATQIAIARPIEPDLASMAQHEVTRQDLTGLSGQEAPFAFALNVSEGDDEGMPVLSDQSLVSLNNALSYYATHDYDVSYLLMDLGTGRGIAGNLDATVYGASSFKGPYCAYLVEKELNRNIKKLKQTRREQVENTITWSDNNSYSKLRRAFGTDGMEDWLADAGVDTSLVDDTYFPHYTGRQSALMWLKIYQFLSTSESSTAEWFSNLLSSTEVSFLRNGALGTTSAGDTDYLPAEDSGKTEAEEEEALKNDAGTADDEDGEADGSGGSEPASGSGEGGGQEKSSFAISIVEGLKAVENAGNGDGADGDGDADGDSASDEASDDGEGADDGDKTVASIGTNIVVRNKAGWINGQEDDAICDSGIVTINGRDYLMVIMTSAPDSAEGEQAFAHLARTLFEIRSDLV